jgi:hypothetical protein
MFTICIVYKAQVNTKLPLVDVYQLTEKVILMQNLKQLGYKVLTDFDPKNKFSLTMEQVMKLLQFSAQFHALGYKFLSDIGREQFSDQFPLVANAGNLGQFITTNEDVK